MEDKKIATEGMFLRAEAWNGTKYLIWIPEDLPLRNGEKVKVVCEPKPTPSP